MARDGESAGTQAGDRFQAGWRRRFEEFASVFSDDAGIAGWSRSGLESRVRFFRRLWNVRTRNEGSIWLDLGCGAGTYARILDEQGIAVVGCDYSQLALEKARERSPSRIPWVVSDVTRLPFRGQTADGALCFGVVQALTESASAVREIAYVLKDGGEAWIDGLNAWCIPNLIEIVRRKLKGLPPHLRYERPGRVLAAMCEAGFTDVRLYWMPLLPARFGRVQRLVESAPIGAILRWVPPLGALLSHSFVVTGTMSPVGDRDG